MILTILFGGVIAGLDNLQVCSALGLIEMSGRRRLRLAAAFTLCETAAPLVGILLGQALLMLVKPYTRVAEPVITIACAIAIVVLAFRETPDDRPLFGLPLALSFDNLAAGVGLSPFANPAWVAALVIGAVSAAMSCAGLYGASAVRPWLARFIPARAELFIGGYLCVLAVRMALSGA